jgi:hypothetical protein
LDFDFLDFFDFFDLFAVLALAFFLLPSAESAWAALGLTGPRCTQWGWYFSLSFLASPAASRLSD